MTTPIPGLNKYDKKAKKVFAFNRFQWVLSGAVARSAQPYYTGAGDSSHTLRPFDVKFLQLNKIVCVISANRHYMAPEGLKNLAAAGIDFFNFTVVDFAAPTIGDLQTVADKIEQYRNRAKNPGATLIYCGFGEGRTGTFAAGWAMSKFFAGKSGVKGMYTFKALKDHFGVEREAQARAISDLMNRPFPTEPAAPIPAPPPLPLPNFNDGPPGLPPPATGNFADFNGALSGLSLPGNAGPPGFSGGGFPFDKSMF